MQVFKKQLSRRTLLRGLGTAVALPLLDAMVPSFTALAKTAANPQRRFGAIYIPHGAIMDRYTPKTDGKGFAFTPILKPLEPSDMPAVRAIVRQAARDGYRFSSLVEGVAHSVPFTMRSML